MNLLKNKPSIKCTDQLYFHQKKFFQCLTCVAMYNYELLRHPCTKYIFLFIAPNLIVLFKCILFIATNLIVLFKCVEIVKINIHVLTN